MYKKGDLELRKVVTLIILAVVLFFVISWFIRSYGGITKQITEKGKNILDELNLDELSSSALREQVKKNPKGVMDKICEEGREAYSNYKRSLSETEAGKAIKNYNRYLAISEGKEDPEKVFTKDDVLILKEYATSECVDEAKRISGEMSELGAKGLYEKYVSENSPTIKESYKQEILGKYPSSMYAILIELSSNFDEAKANQLFIDSVKSGDYEILFQLAEIYYKNNKKEKALEAYRILIGDRGKVNDEAYVKSLIKVAEIDDKITYADVYLKLNENKDEPPIFNLEVQNLVKLVDNEARSGKTNILNFRFNINNENNLEYQTIRKKGRVLELEKSMQVNGEVNEQSIKSLFVGAIFSLALSSVSIESKESISFCTYNLDIGLEDSINSIEGKEFKYLSGTPYCDELKIKIVDLGSFRTLPYPSVSPVKFNLVWV